jgi:hypothetical protein
MGMNYGLVCVFNARVLGIDGDESCKSLEMGITGGVGGSRSEDRVNREVGHGRDKRMVESEMIA